MNSFLWQLLELALLQIVLFALYLMCKNFISEKAKRRTILLLPVVPIGIVFIRTFLVDSGVVFNTSSIELSEIVVNNVASEAWTFSWELLYLSGLAVFTIWSILKVCKLFYFFRKAVPFLYDARIKILSTELKDSFSFFNRIHLSAHLKEGEKKVVLDHELMHTKKGHSFDLIIMEVYHSFFWYNPLLFLLKKELIEVHEFEVDGEMYKKYNTHYLSHLISYALGTSSAHILLTSQFYNKLTLAKRIKKMKVKSKNKNSILFAFPIVALGLALISWVTPVQADIPDVSNEIFLGEGELDQKPEFKGGQEAMSKYMGENVKYPKEAQKKNIAGTVFVKFVVEADGEITGAKVQKGAHELLDAEALRVIKAMPAWNPGMKDGKKVKTEMTLPIKFQF